MKNIINYYYGLTPKNIHQRKELYYFEYQNKYYVIYPYNGNLELLIPIFNFHLFLLNNGLYIHKIILNQDKNIATIINDSTYVLLQVSDNSKMGSILNRKAKLSTSNILPFLSTIINPIFLNTNSKNKNSINFSSLKRANLKDLWIRKNDYLEQQISQFGKKYPVIEESFNYYIGMGETAIQLLNTASLDNIPLVAAHRRIDKEYKIFNLYNPLNLVIDSRARDIAEFLKTEFFNSDNYNQINSQIINVINSFNFNQNEFIIFLSRMLYPTYYFDVFDDIIAGNANEEKLKKIIDKANDYEVIIKNIYQHYKSFAKVEVIEWLE